MLQEVAAARRILIICGPAEMDGYAFCLGLDNLKLPNKTHSELQSLIPSVTYLIRGAIVRLLYERGLSCEKSLGELIDMYHTRNATVHHDKLYALLGMSSDGLGVESLSLNYQKPWREVLRKLIIFLLSDKVFVKVRKAWDMSEMAVIESNGYILGQVSSPETGTYISNLCNLYIDIVI